MREDLLKTIEYLKHISDDPDSEFIPKLKEIAPDAFNENGDLMISFAINFRGPYSPNWNQSDMILRKVK